MKAIVCGAGRVGHQVSRRLAAEGNTVTVIDTDSSRLHAAVDSFDVTGVVGFASHPAVLERAGANDTDMIIAATRYDEVNMMTCQVAHSVFGTPQKIARIRSRGYLDKRWSSMFNSKRVPVDQLIYPERDVAVSIAHWLEMPAVAEVVPFLSESVRFVRLKLGEECPVVETPLKQLTELFEGLRTIVLAVQRGERLLVMSGADDLQVGDKVQFVAPVKEVGRTLELFGHEMEGVKRLLVIGGGNIGATVAMLAAQDRRKAKVRLIEQDIDRAESVAQEWREIDIIQGDALDPEVLKEGKVADADAVVAVTNDQRVNLLAGALAKAAGAKRALALVTSEDMSAIADRLDIDTTINPENATVSSILKHIRHSSIKAIHTVQGMQGDVLEAEVLATSEMAGKRLRDAKLPENSRVGAVLGSDGSLKSLGADLILENKDRVVLLADSRDMRFVEGLFRVGLGFF